MNLKNSSPNSISHKELSILLKKAFKEKVIDEYPSDEVEQTEKFNQLLSCWSEKSHQILHMLNKKEALVTKDKNSKSLIALGAMGAHLNMALQALKSIESDP